MSWSRVAQVDLPGDEPLVRRIDALLAQQRATWPALRDGQQALRLLETRTLVDGGDSIVVQVNPSRRRSTHAKVDAQSVAARACFLCPQNMPVEERGIPFEDLVVLPNPYPILPRHCTIADREHRPQQLAGRVGTLVRLAASIGPEMAAFYNGPRCGASAPDHFHLQASGAAEIPILQQLSSFSEARQRACLTSFGRSMLVLASRDSAELQIEIERAIETLRGLDQCDDEPMFNLLVHCGARGHLAVLFPRRAHRPACYFTEGPDHLSVSPAVLEMAGILVTPDAEQFARIDAVAARTIYEEVSIAPQTCRQVFCEGESFAT